MHFKGRNPHLLKLKYVRKTVKKILQNSSLFFFMRKEAGGFW